MGIITGTTQVVTAATAVVVVAVFEVGDRGAILRRSTVGGCRGGREAGGHLVVQLSEGGRGGGDGGRRGDRGR